MPKGEGGAGLCFLGQFLAIPKLQPRGILGIPRAVGLCPGGAEPLLPGSYEAMGRNWGKKMPPPSKILPLGLARVSSKEVLFLFFSCLLALPLSVPKGCSKAAPRRSRTGWDGGTWCIGAGHLHPMALGSWQLSGLASSCSRWLEDKGSILALRCTKLRAPAGDRGAAIIRMGLTLPGPYHTILAVKLVLSVSFSPHPGGCRHSGHTEGCATPASQPAASVSPAWRG